MDNWMTIGRLDDFFGVDSIENLKGVYTDNLEERIISVAHFFGFQFLPKDLKLHLQICNRDDFEKARVKTNLSKIRDMLAFTCNVNHIYVLQRDCLSEWVSDSSYAAIIVHECVHIFQLYYSRLPQKQYVWLYEAVACYLAGQKKDYVGAIGVSWQNFADNFYGITNCYGLAYAFGEQLFLQHNTIALEIIKDPKKYETILKNMFYSIM